METTSQQEARLLIESIHSEHTLNGTITGTRFESLLQNCLDILASQLYEKSTHFLLEVIQNADDNTYADAIPTLKFTYKPGALRIDCNEIGFTEQNVEAICAVNKSTKAGKSRDGEFIGEKGIGFKSVFKAAEIVWIASRDFTFKFDKTKILGMVVPIWEEFPEPVQSAGTSMLLQLARDYDQDTLIQELRTFDTNLMIFLRKLLQIEIVLDDSASEQWSNKISKEEHRQGETRLVALTDTNGSHEYLLKTHTILELPVEKKRQGWPYTKILLGFPTAVRSGPYTFPPQNVYASLPIRSFGLKVLVQGDFLLTASREDIESTLPWNRAIRDGFVHAFLYSIDQFNEDSSWRYLWPCYLPSTTTASATFFEPAVSAILDALRGRPILQSCAGTMETPISLRNPLADSYTADDGVPFTLNSTTKHRYLSSSYPVWVLEHASAIGLTSLSPGEFLVDLVATISENPIEFQSRDAGWHAKLSDTLLKMTTDPALMAVIATLTIIPLQDGQWTSSKGLTIFFAKGESSLEIPSGIEVLVVDSAASDDSRRKRLFSALGVKPWEAPEICSSILQAHQNPQFDAKTLTVQQLVSHVAFLYNASWRPPKGTDLWFATTRGERCHGSKLYIPSSSDSKYAAARIFHQLEKQFPVLHGDYLTAVEGDNQWPNWLATELRLSRIPRLITPLVDPRPQPLSLVASAGIQIPEDDVKGGHAGDELTLKKLQPAPPPAPDGAIFSSYMLTIHGVDTKLIPQNIVTFGQLKDFIEKNPSVAGRLSIPLIRKYQARSKVKLFTPIQGTSKIADALRRPHELVDAPFSPVSPVDSDEDQDPMIQANVHGRSQRSQSMTEWWAARKAKAAADRHVTPSNSDPALAHDVPSIAQEEEGGFDLSFTQDGPDVLENFDFDSFLNAEETAKAAADRHITPTYNYPASVYDVPSIAQEQKGGLDLSFTQDGPDVLEDFDFDSFLHAEDTGMQLTGHDSSKQHTRLSDLPQSPTTKYGIVSPTIPGQHTLQDISGQEMEPRPDMDAASKSDPIKESQPYREDLSSDTKFEASPIFRLSEEMIYIFETCRSSDVLHIMRDNWHYYSQWIEGAHMSWQDDGFQLACAAVKKDMASFAVQTLQGDLPLRDTVLPNVDLRLEQRRSIPALHLDTPASTEWAFLSNFGVIMKNNIHYYLRCLLAMSQTSDVDIEDITHVYEQIESHYQENEPLVNAAFHTNKLVYLQGSSQTSSIHSGWFNVHECLSKHVDLDHEYPRSTYLFRCLTAPSGNPIGPLIASASLITNSTRISDISRLFQDICTALKDVNPTNAAHLLRPLRNMMIFPIKRGASSRHYMADAGDTGWYIADRPSVYDSFLGQLPLLALSVEESCRISDFFRSLRLENRLLSSQATATIHFEGRISTHSAYTKALRSKIPFIIALLPNKSQDRARTEGRVNSIRASICCHISQTFSLRHLGSQIRGSPVRSQVALDVKDNSLNVLMTPQCAAAENPPHELAVLIAENCGIKDLNHRALLHTTFCTSDLEALLDTYRQQGLAVAGLIITREKRSSHRGPSLQIPNFPGRRTWMGGISGRESEGMRFDRLWDHRGTSDDQRDRRLPIIHTIGEDGDAYDDIHQRQLVWSSNELNGWEYLQYLGELMVGMCDTAPEFTVNSNQVSKMLSTYLGTSYRPERDWAGFTPLCHSTSQAAFFLRDAEVVKTMTSFVKRYGRCAQMSWQEQLDAQVNYYVDVFARANAKTSPFALGSGQIERMRRFRLHRTPSEAGPHNVSVLISVSDLYGGDSMTTDIFIDPWSLFEADKLILDGKWLMTGTMPADGQQAGQRKRRKLDAPITRWADARDAAAHQKGRVTLRTRIDYDHKALRPGQMRLLYLLPGSGRDPIQGVILHVYCHSAPLFRTLSYVWGSTERRRTLLTPEGVVHITQSLSNALHGLRQKTKPILIWCDAICINQDDRDEKEQQIRLLPRIFQQASSTYAFLKRTENSDAALEMLMQVRARAMIDERAQESTHEFLTAHGSVQDVEAAAGASDNGHVHDAEDDDMTISSDSMSATQDWPLHIPPIPDTWVSRSIPHPVDKIWKDVQAFFKSDWFRRAWIIQEIVATPQVKIVCGKWIIDWHDLHQAMEVVDRELELTNVALPDIHLSWAPFMALAAQRQWESEQSRWSLITLLEKFRFAQSTVFRDRFFALLGLACDGHKKEFEPDYESPLEDVVLKFAKVFITQKRGLQLISRAGISSESERFASWIPDWTGEQEKCLHQNNDNGTSFSASGPQDAVITCRPDSNELSAAGYLVDGIAQISEACNEGDEWVQFFHEVDEMIDSANLCRVRASRTDLKWMVPIAGALRPNILADDDLDLQSSYLALRDHLAEGATRAGPSEEALGMIRSEIGNACSLLLQHMSKTTSRQRSSNYIEALGGTLVGWRLVITERGYAGMVPKLARQGDVVSIIKGGLVPFVLRESDSRKGAYRLVGESYIHGIMNGEALTLDGVTEGTVRIH